MYETLSALPRWAKTSILLGLDALVLAAAYGVALALAGAAVQPARAATVLVTALLAMPVLAIVSRVTAVKLASFDQRALQRLGASAAGTAIVLAAAEAALGGAASALVPVATGALAFAGWIAVRVGGLNALDRLRHAGDAAERVAIWGAGAAGMQVAAALARSREYAPVLLIDDNRALQGLIIAGLPVGGEGLLRAWARQGRVDRVFVAIPSLATEGRAELLRRAADSGLPVKALPAYADLLAEGDLMGSLRTVRPDDLLGRDAVTLDVPQVAAGYRGRSVMVTGAGGSIGSELCRQALAAGARALVMVDRGEYNLYAIEQELSGQDGAVRPVAVLADACDGAAMRRVMRAHEVDVVLHAAAYKHVPLVEGNELAGARNNVMGTQTVAEAAEAEGVGRFVLISTDKAVRPANVMGATKRVAEMIVQDMQTRSRGTVFSLVRFGNVLGSSGSVIPLFKRQIAAGGPVTLTHADVTRYFMTVSEAARLVMLAGSLAEGGEVFVLDMGEPVRIHDLARRMIVLSGRSVRGRANPNGDIEIRVDGLRPGEKLFEELLIDASTMPTPHPKILRAAESAPSQIGVARILADLRAALEAGDAAAARAVVMRAARGQADAAAGESPARHARPEIP
ncbi:MAG: polysaccharide biosynthesis protein [Hasllibacter sp.]